MNEEYPISLYHENYIWYFYAYDFYRKFYNECQIRGKKCGHVFTFNKEIRMKQESNLRILKRICIILVSCLIVLHAFF